MPQDPIQKAAVYQQSLSDLLRRTAGRVPHKTAIRCGETTWRYTELDHICTRLAAGLWAQGIRPGDRVAILSRNSHSFAAMRFALARIGAVLVPINFMLNAQEIAFILQNSGTTALAIGPDFLENGLAARASKIATLLWLPGEKPAAPPSGLTSFEELIQTDAPIPAVEVDARTLAQIVYTSGTESLPKGAMLTHEAVIWQYVSCIIEGEMTADDVVLHALPLYHCAQLDVFLGPAIYIGVTNVITSEPRPDVILPLIAEHRITSFFAPPSIWIALLRSPLLDHRLVVAAKGLLRRVDHAG
jgi:fatty-acyl-CoA synthase